jgi:hypothetical protein
MFPFLEPDPVFFKTSALIATCGQPLKLQSRNSINVESINRGES